MILPNFIIVGAQKSGTTTLYDVLNNHPEVNMSLIKEVNYFTSNKKMSKGLEYYSKSFRAPEKTEKVTGEASPGYMCYPGVAKQIKKDLGDIKIVMILRDPIQRAFSQYWDNRRHLSEYMTENEIVDKYLFSEYIPGQRGYFSRGTYINYIKEYVQNFEVNQIHIIILEELIRDPEMHLKSLFEFLKISTSKKHLKLNKASNSSMIWKNPIYLLFLRHPRLIFLLPKYVRKFLFFGKKSTYKYNLPSLKITKTLQNFYAPFVKELEGFLGREMKYWKMCKKDI